MMMMMTVMQHCVSQMAFTNVDEFKKVTGEVWIGLKQNIIHSADNERRNHLCAHSYVMRRHFEYFYCMQLKIWSCWLLARITAQQTIIALIMTTDVRRSYYDDSCTGRMEDRRMNVTIAVLVGLTKIA